MLPNSALKNCLKWKCLLYGKLFLPADLGHLYRLSKAVWQRRSMKKAHVHCSFSLLGNCVYPVPAADESVRKNEKRKMLDEACVLRVVIIDKKVSLTHCELDSSHQCELLLFQFLSPL